MEDKLQAHSLIGLLERADARRAAELMAKDNIGAVGIYDGTAHRLAGIVTERNIVHAVAEGRDLTKTCVTEIMTPDPITVDAPLSRDRARTIMNSAHIRHLIVREAVATTSCRCEILRPKPRTRPPADATNQSRGSVADDLIAQRSDQRAPHNVRARSTMGCRRPHRARGARGMEERSR